MTAHVADARRFGAWPADRVSLGTTFGDPAGAWTAAVAEAVERYCGNRLPPPGHPDAPRRATAAQLTAEGHQLYGPDDVPAYAPWQYRRPAFPYAPLTPDTPALWARGTENGRDCWAPVALTHLNWRQGNCVHCRAPTTSTTRASPPDRDSRTPPNGPSSKWSSATP
ncbi:YcaO-like family protein [Actinomadura keratinilytica]